MEWWRHMQASAIGAPLPLSLGHFIHLRRKKRRLEGGTPGLEGGAPGLEEKRNEYKYIFEVFHPPAQRRETPGFEEVTPGLEEIAPGLKEENT